MPLLSDNSLSRASKRICRVSKRRSLLLFAMAAVGAAFPANAGASGESNDHSKNEGPAAAPSAYPASYFAPFAPRTALDIANEVPGFGLDVGNSSVRGFAAAAGNVVINGVRPSTKSETLDTYLSHIPASRVVRVELGPGDLFGADYAGKAQVLNIILSSASGISGDASVSAQRRHTGLVVPNAEATAVIKQGASTFTLSGATGRTDYVSDERDRYSDARTGELLESRRKLDQVRQRNPYLSASWSLAHGADDQIHVNGRFAPSSFDLAETNHVSPTGAPERDDLFVSHDKTPSVEIGADISRPFGGGAIKLVGLATRSRRHNFDAYYVRDDGESQVLGGFEQYQRSSLGETIGRLSWSKPKLLGFNFEGGAEVAYNKLDYHLDLYGLDGSGGKTHIDLPLDNATVSEFRSEYYANGGRQLTKALRLDLELRYEHSDLKVRGDANAERKLGFFKPGLTLDWQSHDGWHAQLMVQRTVAQLDFYDFMSVADLGLGQVNGGNANLQPQRSWLASAIVEHPVLGDGLLKLELGYELVSLLQDRILTPQSLDAPGNIGTGKRPYAELTYDLPLTRIGLTGVRWKGYVYVQRTRVIDPIWGTPRPWTGFRPWLNWWSELRRDHGRFSYGVDITDRTVSSYFRTEEIDKNRNPGPYGTAFAEFRPGPKTTLRLDIDNLFDTPSDERRWLFVPNRTDPVPQFYDRRTSNKHFAAMLTFKRSFGGGKNKALAPESAR